MTNADETAELAEIRRELREMRWHLDDQELRRTVSNWIDASHDKSDADSAKEYVERELNAMLARYSMYHSPDLERPQDGFPPDCHGCEHVGGACPVLKDSVERQWRERLLDQASTEHEARRIYQQQAIDVSCQRIPELLEEWDNRHAEFVQHGQRLLAKVEEELLGAGAIGDDVEDDLGLEDDTLEALADGGRSE